MRHFIHLKWLVLLLLMASCKQVREGTSLSGQIYVTTVPTGAMVVFDDALCDQTPTTLKQVLPGDHLLVVRKSGYHEARKTVMIQPGERVAVEIKLEPIVGTALIHSIPKGADVEIDNANYGKTPLLITDFALGKHRLKLSAHGYLPKIVEVTVLDQTPLRIDVRLVSDSAQLVIGSTPQGAQVTIDGSAGGKTPCTIPAIASGIHKIDITLKGYSPYSDEFTVQAGDLRKIDVTLVSLPGSLSVVSIPDGARIYLNNRFRAESPFSRRNIPAGKYVVRAELRGHETQTITNVVISGEESVVEFQMVRNSGTILLTTEPPGVSVYLDGDNQGKTKTRGQELISNQIQIDLVARGKRNLQLTKQGYYNLTKTVEVEPNQTIILHERLKRRPVPFVPNVIIRTGTGEEHTFRGIIREKYENGDTKLEIARGIFKLFRRSEIVSVTPIPSE